MVVGMARLGWGGKAQIVPRVPAPDDGSTEWRYRALAFDRVASRSQAMTRSATLPRWAAAACCALFMSAGAVWPARAQAVESVAPAEGVYGTVRSIERAGSADTPHGTGALVGGLLGAVVGRQFADSSHGRNIGTAVGAAAGALIGHEIEKGMRRERAAVRIAVTLDDGSVRSFEFRDSSGDLRVGDRVRVDGKMLYRVS
jgi:outer membrane lipoprotein SlyB